MIYTHTQLRAEHSRREIEHAVTSGQLTRAGRYFVLPGTDDAVVAAFGKGARPTCLTAARHHGLWTPPGAGRHVYARRGRPVPGAWVTHGFHRTWPEPDPVASPQLLLEHACRCLEPLHVGILAESALHQGVLHEADVAAICRTAPRQVQRVLGHATSLSESGTESKVRLHLELRRVPVRAQVVIDGVGRVDLLVGERWIIECDSKAHHTDKAAYAKDRGRDIRSAERGYVTSRLTYDMCFGEWEDTVTRLDTVVASGQHLIPPEEWIRARRIRRR
ncbi:MAG TPA: hypothetical protein H9805_00630 [Candidatus Janibacter merdipullorum]|nr:hypothetical protein [Candidatus Janibacter merdipullorum]